MTDKSKEPDNGHSQKTPKLKVPEAPEKILRRIFGTSHVFYAMEDTKKPKAGSSVPAKVREYYNQGHQCLLQEDWEMAVLFFSRALHLDPKLVDFYVFRAEAFIQLCDFSSALQNLRRAYSYDPGNDKYLDRLAFVLYLQGQCLYELCDFQEALCVFLQASDLQPQNASFSYRCMACLLALKRYHDCLALITREVKQGRASADMYILRARLYNFFQKAKLCYQDLRSALLLDPFHAQAKGLLQKMVDQAKQSLQDASILAVQGKLHRALKCISCAIENNPLDPNFFLFRGTLRRRLQQFDPAVEDFLKAMDMVTDTQDSLVKQAQRQLLLTYNDFAVHCYTHGAYQEGVLLLNKAIRDEQNEKGLYINRGDCFFQMGNLVFAEADYKQALSLSPLDEGANLRMGVLQEKLGFCQQQHRQFQTAEEHFSEAIRHNPQKPQYYLHRAKCRQFLQNTMGARQDVATVLLLNPNYPKMTGMMNTLFPGMTVENVLKSQVAEVAKLELSRMIENGPKNIYPQSIVVKRLMERRKAQALVKSWKQELLGIPEEEVTIFQAPQVAEVKKVKTSRRRTSLTDSYVDQTSSGSVFSIVSISTSGPEMSTSQEYKSSSHTAIESSESTLPKPGSSEHRTSQELSRGTKVVQVVTEYLTKNFNEITPAYGQRSSIKKTKATQGPKPKPRKTGAPKGPSQSTNTTEAPEGPRPTKSRSTLSLKERIRRAKAVRAQGWKHKAQSSSQKLNISSKTHSDSGTTISTNEAPGQTPGPSKADDSSTFPSKADDSSTFPSKADDSSTFPSKADDSPTFPSKADDSSTFSESTSTNLSNHSESFMELTNLLTQEVQGDRDRLTPAH
ncbi:tetratricopeptide repeat protein 16 isoform X2 [Mastomys coucha]|uniref:tetratricopeptide repeat protein 16 isoform X2 n=1 Tax=Mastomys coucha TaxID=35658 RepID=UPI0012620F26|nr:tetratricopeptide repeat protein 16 isoform X2 [Mastomys coucha]